MVVLALLSSGVAIRTDTGDSTSGDRATGVTATSTSSAGARVGTPLASASAGVFSSVVVGGDAEAEMEAESFGDGGSGRECKFIWLQRGQTQSLDLAIEHQVSATKETETSLDDAYKAARRLRSLDWVSSAPMPIAAWPFRGKKPWRPIMAGRMARFSASDSMSTYS